MTRNILRVFTLFLVFPGGLYGAPPERLQKKEEPRAAIEVPSDQQGRIGLRTAPVRRKVLKHTIRTVGVVSADQRTEAHVHTKLNGWIERIHADFIGKEVKKGQPLFELYSPELVSTQEEYLTARRQGAAGRDLAKAAIERLGLWGVPSAEIERLKTEGKSRRAVTFLSPSNGFVVNKSAIQGMYVSPEMELYHIADLSKIWIIATLYEYDIAVIQPGDEALIQLPYDPNQTYRAKLSYVYPEIEAETRTAKARIEMANPGIRLKPGMFAHVEISKDLGESIVVPDDAVIDTGMRKIVFARASAARFEPRELKLGPRVGNEYAVLEGLEEGEEIVTQAHFLIDAESKFQAALHQGDSTNSGEQPRGHGAHGVH